MQNLTRRLVAGEQSSVFIQGQHARGQLRQHCFQITPLVLHLLLAMAGLVPGSRKPPCHVIEGFHQKPDFVLAGFGQLCLVITVGYGPGALGEVLQRRHHAPRRVEGRPHCGEQAQKKHQGQRQCEAGFQRLSKVSELAVLRVGRLHRLGQRAGSFRDRIQSLQDARLHRGQARRKPDDYANVEPRIADGVQPDVAAGLAQLHEDGVAGPVGNDGGRVTAAGGDDVSVGAN